MALQRTKFEAVADFGPMRKALCVGLFALLSCALLAGTADAHRSSAPLVALHAPKASAAARVVLRWRTAVRVVHPRRISFVDARGRRLHWRLTTLGFRRSQLFQVAAGKTLGGVRIRAHAARTRGGAWVPASAITLRRRSLHRAPSVPVLPQVPNPTPTPPPIPDLLSPADPPAAGPALPIAQPRSAAAFVDSVGVNVHMSYYSTAYNNWQEVRDRLVELGVQHVRDGACVGCTPQRQRLLALANAGIGVDFTMRQPGSPDSLPALVNLLAGPMRPAVDAIEGPNEYDHSGDAAWAANLRAYQKQLYTLVRSTPALAGVPVLGPSLVDSRSYTALGNLADAMDWGNVHPYAGGQIPEINLASNLRLETTVTPFAPVAVTEAGYHNALHATSGQPPTSETAAAAYVPRLFLEMFQAGVPRTYLYELLDERADPGATQPESEFGLLRSNFSEKPAFQTLATLLHLLAPTGNAQLAPVHLAIDGASSDLRQILLQRGPGSYALVLWRNAKIWDQTTRRETAVGPVNVRVRLPAEVKSVRVQQLDQESTADKPAAAVEVGVSAMPVVVTLTE